MNGSKVQALIGAETSEQADFLAYIGEEPHIPIISFYAVSSSLSPTKVPFFVRMAQNDSSQVRSIAAVVQAFGWREVVIIHDDSNSGIGLIPYLTDAIQEIDAKVSHRLVLTSTESSINKTLHKITEMGTRVFIVHVSFSVGKRFFINAHRAGMMEKGYAWIITSDLTNRLCYMNSSVLNSMQGVLGVQTFVPESEMLDDFKVRWKQRFRRQFPDIEILDLDPYSLWAYDTVWLLAMAAEKTSFQFNENFNSPDSQNLMGMDVSPNGANYLKSILGTKLQGLTGDIQLVGGQLQYTHFQIVNVLGKGGRCIGYWTPHAGLSRSRSSKDMEKNYAVNADDLGGIIWPGGSTTTPKGWVFGRTLKIGVPVKTGFSEFIKVDIDPNDNKTVARGFCVEVFEKVMSMDYLHYPVLLEYVEFDNGHAGEPGYYDDLIYQVHLKKYDAVVGDITITANRSIYVDFTVPYVESGVSMIVPIQHDITKSLWWFTKPFKWHVWLTIFVLLGAKGFLVWLFERENNEEFQGPWQKQLGTTFYFSFSLFHFSQRENLKTNYSRVVVVVWTLLAFLIVTSYNANLTAMLTVEKVQPSITDIDSLIRNGDYVGYQSASFLLEYLKDLGFSEDKLKPYATTDEYAEALSRGSSNNGVSAIIDEIPYIEIFLKKYCHKYNMAGPTFQTGGFGFVFPRGFDMVPDVSKAILNLSSSEDMFDIENKWFGAGSTFLEDSLETPVTDNELPLKITILAEFIITSGIAMLAVVAFLSEPYWKRWRERNRNSRGPSKGTTFPSLQPDDQAAPWTASLEPNQATETEEIVTIPAMEEKKLSRQDLMMEVRARRPFRQVMPASPP
ncbi:glutamate receptor 2.8-like protein [Cinnamomum micranthum f. kanehirae]|uniref:Glutamate receptor n=1 Tax=Cinnamomum micranthum f. kanehirae TaxID=337451 RepID=A0A3S3MI94_9MAGN|nr:glutamate receptor 2.8-like protein [Cinnamomum micranthum f. kanehirae]